MGRGKSDRIFNLGVHEMDGESGNKAQEFAESIFYGQKVNIDNMFKKIRAELFSWVESMYGDTSQSEAIKNNFKILTQNNWKTLIRKQRDEVESRFREIGFEVDLSGSSLEDNA